MLGRRSGALGAPQASGPGGAAGTAAGADGVDRVDGAGFDQPHFDEARLLRGVRERDERALALIYDRYAGLVYAVALRIVGDRHLAEEVLQDTFFRCWDEIARFDPARGRLSGWLLGVARNRAIDLLRSRQHQARLHERESLAPADRLGDGAEDAAGDSAAPWGPTAPWGAPPPAEPSGDDLVLLRETVSQALERLPLVQRQAIALAYFGGLTQSEIAAQLGVPLGTVKTRIRDGMERLRRTLRPLIDPDAHEVAGPAGPSSPGSTSHPGGPTMVGR